MRFSGLFALALTGVALVLAGPAKAQDTSPKVGDRIGDWTYQCQAVSAAQTLCGIVQNIADRGTQKTVLSVGVRQMENGSVVMIVTAPLGIFLGAGIGGKVDENEQFAFNLQSCTQRGCQAAIEVKDKLLDDMKRGNRLVIGFKGRPDANTIAVPISLQGFTAGLAALQSR